MKNFISKFRERANTPKFIATRAEQNELCEKVINSSSLSINFYLLTILSTVIVTAGLLKNNVILVIGGMLVAPLLSPILSISLSLTIINLKVFFRSIKIFAFSSFVSLITAFTIGLIANFDINNIELIGLMNPDLSTLLISVAAGIAGSLIWIKKSLNKSLPGIMITATLLPPLVISGLILASKDYEHLTDVLNVFFLNVLGIIIGSLIIFIILDFHRAEKKIIKEVAKEENQ